LTLRNFQGIRALYRFALLQQGFEASVYAIGLHFPIDLQSVTEMLRRWLFATAAISRGPSNSLSHRSLCCFTDAFVERETTQPITRSFSSCACAFVTSELSSFP
jgi:hypothetical protein